MEDLDLEDLDLDDFSAASFALVCAASARSVSLSLSSLLEASVTLAGADAVTEADAEEDSELTGAREGGSGERVHIGLGLLPWRAMKSRNAWRLPVRANHI